MLNYVRQFFKIRAVSTRFIPETKSVTPNFCLFLCLFCISDTSKKILKKIDGLENYRANVLDKNNRTAGISAHSLPLQQSFSGFLSQCVLCRFLLLKLFLFWRNMFYKNIEAEICEI